jgi:pyruvate dehydrogenase E2 component (dihydrolipoamide acetyltransferase)
LTLASRTTVVVPDLGDFHDVEVIDVLVKAGDTVALEAPLITLETDKATMDVPSTAAGRIAEVPVRKGDRVSKGSPVIVVESEGAAAPAAKPAGAVPAAEKIAAAPVPAAAPAAAPAPSAPIEVRVPDLGDFKNVEVIEVLVKEGDAVALETPLITLETEKATMDVPSSAAGTIVKLEVRKGSRVNAGDIVARVRGSGAAAPAAAAAASPATPAAAAPNADATVRMTAPAAAARAEAVPLPDIRTAHASPSVRRFARELGVDLARVTGSGFKGRISEDDVKAYVKKALAAPPRADGPGGALPRVPDVDFKAFGPVEVKPLGPHPEDLGRQAAGRVGEHPARHAARRRGHHGDGKAPVSLKDRAAGLGIKLTPLAFIARASAKVIAQFPNFNSSLDARRPEPGLQEVPAPRLRGRHAERTRRPGDPRRRPQGHLRARARPRRAGRPRRAPAS